MNQRTKSFLKMVQQKAGVTFCHVERTNGGHLRARVTNCETPFIMAATASDHRAVDNVASFIRRTLRSTSLAH